MIKFSRQRESIKNNLMDVPTIRLPKQFIPTSGRNIPTSVWEQYTVISLSWLI